MAGRLPPTDGLAGEVQSGPDTSRAGITEDWWEVVWGAGSRGLVEQLPPARHDVVRDAHLAEVAPLMTDKGLWLDITVHFAVGRKP